MSKKEEKFVRVAESALKIIWKEGIDAISHTKVARLAGVSRPWLYKYVGNSRNDVLIYAVDYFGTALSELDQQSMVKDHREWLESNVNGFRALLKDAVAFPWVLPIYFRYKGTPTVIGERIETVENAYLKSFVKKVEALFDLDHETALSYSEIIMTLKLSLAQRWTVKGRLSSIEQDQYVLLFETFFKDVRFSQNP